MKDANGNEYEPAIGAKDKNWPHGYLPCGCYDNGKGQHAR